jgi:hypothetical protein
MAMSISFSFAALIRFLHSFKLNTDVFPILLLFDSAKMNHRASLRYAVFNSGVVAVCAFFSWHKILLMPHQ